MISNVRRRLRDYLANRLQVPSIEACLQRLAARGFMPDGVYDVGAYKGEFARLALSFWPTTHVTCFEPQDERVADLNRLTAEYPNQITAHQTLLGAEENAEVTFHLGDTAASVYPNACGEQYPTTSRPMTTVDHIRQSTDSRPCTLLKLDVQGHDFDVLKGAESTLREETQVILAELNVLELYAGVPLAHEIIQWLAERNFVVYDIGQLIRRPLDNTLWQTDFVFVRQDGELRKDKRWNNS